MSVQANGESIIIGSNKKAKERINDIISTVSKQLHDATYMHNLLKVRQDMQPIRTEYIKVRINPSGEMFLKGFKTLEDVAIEINLTLSEI